MTSFEEFPHLLHVGEGTSREPQSFNPLDPERSRKTPAMKSSITIVFEASEAKYSGCEWLKKRCEVSTATCEAMKPQMTFRSDNGTWEICNTPAPKIKMGFQAEDEDGRFDRAVQIMFCDEGLLVNQRNLLGRNLLFASSGSLHHDPLSDGSSCKVWTKDPSARRSHGVSLR